MYNLNIKGMDNDKLPIPKNSRLIKTDKPRPHICNICTRGFVRMEHLKRHKRSHTREKPFMCIFCGRCFSRKDLVVRHQGNVHKDLVKKNNNGKLISRSIVPNMINDQQNSKYGVSTNDNMQLNNSIFSNNEFSFGANFKNSLDSFKNVDEECKNTKTEKTQTNQNITKNSLIDKKNLNVVIINGNKNTIISKDIVDNINNNISAATTKSNHIFANSNTGITDINSYSNNNSNYGNDNTTNNEFILPQASYKRRRFSFSAANSHSYTANNNTKNNNNTNIIINTDNKINADDNINKLLMETNFQKNSSVQSSKDILDDEIPNDVEFSTPQLNSKQLFNKINDINLFNLETLVLPSSIVNMGNFNTNTMNYNVKTKSFMDNNKLTSLINNSIDGITNSNPTDINGIITKTLNENIISNNANSALQSNTQNNVKNLANTYNIPISFPNNHTNELETSFNKTKTYDKNSNSVGIKKNESIHMKNRTKSNPIALQVNGKNTNCNINNINEKITKQSKNLSSNFLLLSNLPSFTDMLTMAPKTKTSLERRQISKILLNTANNIFNNTNYNDGNDNNITDNLNTENNNDNNTGNNNQPKKESGFYDYKNIEQPINEFPPPQPLLRKDSTLSSYGKNINNINTTNVDDTKNIPFINNMCDMNNLKQNKHDNFFSNRNTLITPSSLFTTLGQQQFTSNSKNFDNIMNNINNYNVNNMNYQTNSNQWIQKFVGNNAENNNKQVMNVKSSQNKAPIQNSNHDHNNGNFKIKTNNFNEIGFFPSTSPSASSRSSVASNDVTNNVEAKNNMDNYSNDIHNIHSNNNYKNDADHIYSTNNGNVNKKSVSRVIKKRTKPHKLPNNISNYLTSRQIDIHKMRDEERRKLFGNNNRNDSNENSSDSGDEPGLRINFKSKNTPPLFSSTASVESKCRDTTAQKNCNELPAKFTNNVDKMEDIAQSINVPENANNDLNPTIPTSKTTENKLNTSRNLNKKNNVISTSLGFRYSNYNFFDDTLRSFIIKDNCLNDNYFPNVHQLNNYINLFEFEFARFIPFIHVPSIVPTEENYPLLISMAMVGGLYDFHSSHSKLLFMISNLQVKKKLISLNYNSEATTLWIVQSMVLQAFLGIFNNDSKIIKNMNTHLMTLIQLIKKYNYHLPYETTMQPPVPKCSVDHFENDVDKIELIRGEYDNEEQTLKNYSYFLMAQQRIRICHASLLISNFFASLVGLQCFLRSTDVKCGVPTPYDELFNAKNAKEWHERLNDRKIMIDSKFSLIFLANGGIPFENCLIFLTKGDKFFLENFKISKLTLLSLVVSIHERITLERINIIARIEKALSENIEITREQIELDWKLNALPHIDFLMNNWEMLYMKNDGILNINEATIPLIDGNPVTRMVLPLFLFAKIRRGHDLTYVMNRIWLKDWKMMNKTLDELSYDWHSLQETTEWCVYLLDSWINIVTLIIKSDKIKGGYHTPITTITIMFVCISVISEYLFKLESMAKNNDTGLLDNKVKIIYFSAIVTLRKIQKTLIPEGTTMQSYLEFLQLQTHRYVSTLDDLDDLDEIRFATSEESNIYQFTQLIQKLCLSSRSLYLGVRILGDTPIWPISIVFAQALQKRAIFKVSQNES